MTRVFQNHRGSELGIFLQLVLIGFCFGEAWFLGKLIGIRIYSITDDLPPLIFILIYLSIFITGSLYFIARGGMSIANNLVRSQRIDLLLLFSIGLFLPFTVDGVTSRFYKEFILGASPFFLLVGSFIPILMALFFSTQGILRKPPESIDSFFIADQDIKTGDDDLLDLNERAKHFAQTVLNGGSTQSLVFGIDAPWGIGKSSFINLCCNYWQHKEKGKLIVHRFEPLRYEHSTDLASAFIDDLVNTIEKHVYLPATRPLFSKYSRLVKGTSDFSFFGLRYEPQHHTVEETIENLELLLAEQQWRVIVVVDDLDRLMWSSVKNILFSIKRSFMLPNISYVLCYETENLVSKKDPLDDAEKVKEFLEKFVNIKISLFLSSTHLIGYISQNLQAAFKNNLHIAPQKFEQIRRILDGIKEIYKSNDFPLYQQSLGNVRKLKRLINSLLLFPLIDFENSDLNKQDFIHLLLIYINHPNLFREIYSHETDGRNGYFSAIAGPKNSPWFENRITELSEEQKFLIQKIFSVVRINSLDQSELTSRACFNSPGQQNLERYLQVLVNQVQPSDKKSYKHYLNRLLELSKGTSSLEDIFSVAPFQGQEGFHARVDFLQIAVNKSRDLSEVAVNSVIDYLIDELPNYSSIPKENIFDAYRKTFIYSLLKILDESGWGKNDVERRNNNASNVIYIAYRIFGEKKYKNKGILDRLTTPNRGVQGIYDALLFRLYCSADREGGNLFNLTRALSFHTGPSAPTSGLTTIIARENMREISQYVFKIFKIRYIDNDINIFDEVANLSNKEMLGISDETFEQGKDDNSKFEVARSSLGTFIIYQLSNSLIDSGVGCGLYDEDGIADNGNIQKKMNSYLFNCCFSISTNAKNYEFFLDYLMRNLRINYSLEEPSLKFNLEELFKVLNEEDLKKYWLSIHNDLRDSALLLDKTVTTMNYSVSYKEKLSEIYQSLDKLVQSAS